MSKTCLFILCICVLCFRASGVDEEDTETKATTVVPGDFETNTTTDVVNTTHEMTLLDVEKSMKKFLSDVYSRAFKYVSGVHLPPKASFSCLFSLARVYFGFNALEPWAFRSK